MYSDFYKLLATCVAFSTTLACTKLLPNKKDSSETPIVEQSQSREGLLDVEVDVVGSDAKVSITKIPSKSELKCELDYEPLSDCRDGMTLAKLKDNDYLLHVQATLENKTIAVGEAFFKVGVSEADATFEKADDELELTLSGDFKSGKAYKLDKDITVSFKAKNKIPCKEKYECSYGDKDTSFWRECTSQNSHTVKSAILAKGLQYINIRAVCDNRIGPVLSVYWYGVDERYFENGKEQVLTLDFIKDRKENKYIFHLMKSNDCPENLLKFECKSGGSAATFESCTHIHVNPPSDFQIRAKCENNHGPVLGMDILNGS